jgi:hypothetical protein
MLHGVNFWTSGTDSGCNGKNYWCSIDRRIVNRNMTFDSKESGDCVSVTYEYSSSKFKKVDCGQKMRYICEV